jgi:hypothetical protein
MSTNAKPKSLSAAEVVAGGAALASVALIALGGVHLVQPRNSLPAPKRYASVSIEPPERLSKVSIEQLADLGETRRDAQSPEDRPAIVEPVQQSTAESSPSPSMDHTVFPAAEWQAQQPSEQHNVEANMPGTFLDATAGLSFSAPPRNDRPAGDQRNGMPSPGARGAPTFIGGWAGDQGQCRTSRKAPLVIGTHAARTASGECDFGSVAREAANRWKVVAICATKGNFWRAHIALKLTERSLTWSSERGTETYVRCER